MGVRASFQVIPITLFEKVKARSPSGKAEDIEALYPSNEEWKAVNETDPLETGFGAWWVFQAAFNRLGAPLKHTIQGDLVYRGGIDTSGQEAFAGDHYIGYVSTECVRQITSRISALSMHELEGALDPANHYPGLEEDLKTLQTVYQQAAQLGMAIMITIA